MFPEATAAVLLASTLISVTPADPERVRLAVYGDVRLGEVTHTRIAHQILLESPDAVFTTGDLVQDNDPRHWAAFRAAARDLMASAPYYPALGNHDVWGIFNITDALPLLPGSRYYEVRIGPAVVVVLDSTQSLSAGSNQGRWLRERLTLASALEDAWIITVHHHPVYSTGPHGPEPSMVRDLKGLYEEFGVDLVLQGHDHIYERATLDGVTYVVTGGGGAPLYTPPTAMQEPTKVRASTHHWVRVLVSKAQLRLEAIDVDGNTIDDFIVPRADPAAGAGGTVAGWKVPATLGGLGLLSLLVTLAIRGKKTPTAGHAGPNTSPTA